ncbi:hypothetical protein BGW37DRAFT_113833 [Umbelopsis sp. PMI_123]|nr:hypothetical protein BGW37DRAFT_113833 [Umbelopsis sp. PMI_123]
MLAYALYKKNKEKKANNATAVASKDSIGENADTLAPYDKFTSEASREADGEDGVMLRTNTQKSFTTITDKNARRRQWLSLALTLFVDVIMPIILYYSLRNTVSQLAALLISSIPPAVMSIFKMIWYRTFDALGVVIILGFVLSAVISVIDGDPRVLLLRESIVTCATGVVFLVTMIPIRIGQWVNKPLIYGVTKQMMSVLPPVKYVYNGQVIEETRIEFSWKWSREFKKGMLIMNAAWGVILILEFVAKLIMYFSSLTVDQMVLYGNIVLGVTLGSMGIFNVFYGRRIRLRTIEECKLVQKRLEEEAELQNVYVDEA